MRKEKNNSILAGMGHLEMSAQKYFLVRKRGEKLETEGQASAEFGHQIPSISHTVADGIFARWIWDGTRLVVKNDRYGIYPMFWFIPAGGGVCVSSSLTKLITLGAPTDLDVESLAVFFRLGYFLGNDTPFLHIKVVPPNAVFEWTIEKFECRGTNPIASKETTLTRDEAIDRYIDLFGKAMAKRLPISGAFALPISGGRDSRHILLELHRTGVEPTMCVSAMDNPPNPNEDCRIATALCKELGFRHVVIDQQLTLLSAMVRKNTETHFCALSHGWYLALADFLNSRVECVYDGIAGDVFSQSKFLNPSLNAAFHSQNVNAICEQLLSGKNSSSAAIDIVLKRSLKKAMESGLATKRLALEVEKHLDGPNPIASFIFWNRTRRTIVLAPYSLLAGMPRVYAPFLDHDLFDFFTTLPSKMLMDHTFHDETIARAYPKFAHIPYSDKTAPETDDTAVRARFLHEAACRFVVKKPSKLMSNLVPRAKMLASVLSRGHVNSWVSPLMIYLDQLESLMKTRRR